MQDNHNKENGAAVCLSLSSFPLPSSRRLRPIERSPGLRSERIGRWAWYGMYMGDRRCIAFVIS